MPSPVVAEMPAGASAGFHSNGVPRLAIGSQVAISRAFDPCASSCAWALHTWEPGIVFTCPLTGSMGQALRLPVQSWKVSEVVNCARYATEPLCRPVEFTPVEAVDCVAAMILATTVCRSLMTAAGLVAAK